MTLLESQFGRLRGQVAWITGGKRIGRAVGRALAEQGVGIVASFRRSEHEARELVEQCRALGVPAVAVQADVGSRSSVESAVRRAREHFAEFHILVNMASVYALAPVEDLAERDWEENFRAHVLGSFWPAQMLLPYMPVGAHIINVADACVTGRMRRRALPYQVTKAAVAAMTRAMAVEYAPRGIFVNAIAPGPILRPEDFPEDKWRALRAASPVAWPLSDEEAVAQFALLVLYLAVTTTTTGHTFPLDVGENL
ncbi:MAG: SDR family NAD(P)-dependent oxidoreductase [Bryobacterales bacterium]|nr:SDR family oxidoreductase [Bryobacteraceae bacterium]MDW8130463.1 SDR family NAD(P)-dependent oxidoreductase [Bryobacterales bacterium]